MKFTFKLHKNIILLTNENAGLGVNKDYHQSTNAGLEVVIGSGTYLTVQGTAFIDGALSGTLASGVSLDTGNRFTVLMAGSVSGRFTNPQDLLNVGGYPCQIEYGTDRIEVVVLSSSIIPSAPTGDAKTVTFQCNGSKLYFNTSVQISARISLYSVSGHRTVYFEKREYTPGFHCLPLNINKISQSVIIVHMESGNEKYHFKVLM